MKAISSVVLLLIAIGIASPVSAAVHYTGTLLHISEDIHFSVTGNGTAAALIFDEWGAPSDAIATFAALTGDLTVAVNGIGTTYSLDNFLADNLARTLNDVTANDSYVFWNGTDGPTVSAGDVFTVRAGTWSIAATPDFSNPGSPFFIGNAFISDPGGNRLTSDTAIPVAPVPAPAGLALLGLGAGLVGLMRRRRARKTKA